VPIEARYLVVIMTVLSIFGGISGTGNIAHFAHLGGFLGGYSRPQISRMAFAVAAAQGTVHATPVNRNTVERWRRINRTALHEVNRTEYDRIMSKIETQGIQSLSEDERAFLDRFSAR